MKPRQDTLLGPLVPLLISRSTTSTECNKTGSWRFLRPRYQEKTAPCSATCPAGEDIGRIEMLAAQGLFKEAWEAILMENPFPALCGRVCFHPCEKVCNRTEFDEPVSIHAIERFLAHTAARYELKPPRDRLPAQKEKVAVVGAGPSGLSAAYFLARLGYSCDVYEALPEAGGLPRWAIPPYRLAYTALRSEIERIAELGVRIHCGHPLSGDFLEQASSSFDAVFLGCGQSRGVHLGIPGEELEGVEEGLPLLQKLVRREAPALEGNVAVIGGGNTAVDVARSVVRLGGKPVLIYRRRREDMPAFENEIKMALEEGVEIMELQAPVQIEAGEDGLLLTLQAMQVVDSDELGRARVQPDPRKTQTLRFSRIVKAIGLEAAQSWGEPSPEGTGRVLALSNSLLAFGAGDLPMVYGGDTVTQVKSVVHAIASGKEGALALDTLFREGFEAIEKRLQTCRVGAGPSLSMEIYLSGARSQRNAHIVAYSEINSDHFHFAPRLVQPRLLVEERARSFAEIDLKISAGMAMREAERCFNCGICNQCDNCRLFCPDLAVVRDTTGPGRRINYDYCKGCGICVVECPRNAMALEEEKEAHETRP